MTTVAGSRTSVRVAILPTVRLQIWHLSLLCCIGVVAAVVITLVAVFLSRRQ